MISPSNIAKTELDMEVIVSEQDNVIYVKLEGFDNIEDADQYANYLQENLPLMLFESQVLH
jgi:hypothetical protein